MKDCVLHCSALLMVRNSEKMIYTDVSHGEEYHFYELFRHTGIKWKTVCHERINQGI